MWGAMMVSKNEFSRMLLRAFGLLFFVTAIAAVCLVLVVLILNGK